MANLLWDNVPEEVSRLIKLASPVMPRLRRALRVLENIPRNHPRGEYGDAWYNPDTKQVWISLGDGDEKETIDAWSKGMKVPGVESVRVEAEYDPPEDEPWIRVKSAVMLSDLLSVPGQMTGATSGNLNALWGGPRPLSDMIAGGVLGAGAGYGAGWLAENILPTAIANRRLRKTLAALGGAAGAMPGMAQAIDNASQGQGLLAPWPVQKQSSLLQRCTDKLEAQYPGFSKLSQGAEPAAFTADFVPFIDRDGLNNLILRDQNMVPAIAAATTGIVNGAAELRGNDARFISPFDIGRIALGMGSGLISGLVVGRTLGALTGLSSEAQTQLTRAGVVAGLLANVVPMMFNR